MGFFNALLYVMNVFSVLFHPVYPETQRITSHLSSLRTEVTRIENVCIDDAHGTATQKSRMDQQMSTALHGMPNSVTKQPRDICTFLQFQSVPVSCG